jgi:hypothetical protein
VERSHLRVRAVKQNMLSILDIIVSLSASHKSQVGEEVEIQIVPRGFNAKGVDTKSETSHTANDILRKVKKHVWEAYREDE